tara:strand:- start:296 stop:682 length:387 start_codon:yes stop_codon:yes gene_type:complete
MSQAIIVDACGWVAIIDAEINFEIELEKIYGNNTLILFDKVLQEIELLQQTRPRTKSLLVSLLTSKSQLIDTDSNYFNHTDDLIFDFAKENLIPVITVDKKLKKRLYQSGIDVIEIAKKSHLKLIEGL